MVDISQETLRRVARCRYTQPQELVSPETGSNFHLLLSKISDKLQAEGGGDSRTLVYLVDAVAKFRFKSPEVGRKSFARPQFLFQRNRKLHEQQHHPRVPLPVQFSSSQSPAVAARVPAECNKNSQERTSLHICRDVLPSWVRFP